MRFLVLFICLVCIYDIYCTVKYADMLPSLEQNAIAKAMISEEVIPRMPPTMGQIRHSNVDVSKLVAFKCLGLLAAADILEWMIRKNSRWSRTVIYSMTLIQMALLFYLVF